MSFENYYFLLEVVDGLPEKNPEKDLTWLKEKLQPRMSPSGEVDLGDGLKVNIRETTITIINPLLPPRPPSEWGVWVREMVIKRYGHFFEICGSYGGGYHSVAGTAGTLKEQMKKYFNVTPPPLTIYISKLKNEIRRLQSEVSQKEWQIIELSKTTAMEVKNLQEEVKNLQEEVKRLNSKIRATVVWLVVRKKWRREFKQRLINFLLPESTEE